MLSNYILSTAYFGPISYYANFIQTVNPIIEVNEYYVKQSIRNRCYIYSSNGKLRLTVPKINSSKKIISDIKVCYAEDWQKKQWNTIISSYNSSPYFNYYKDKFYELFITKEKYLIDINFKIHTLVLSIIDCEKKIKQSSLYEKKGCFIDLRNYLWEKDIIKKYDQVFMNDYGFISNLSILDLIFNLGPESNFYLKNLNLH